MLPCPWNVGWNNFADGAYGSVLYMCMCVRVSGVSAYEQLHAPHCIHQRHQDLSVECAVKLDLLSAS